MSGADVMPTAADSVRSVLAAAVVVGLLVGAASSAAGCPFCGVVGESLAERRDAAVAFAVGEAVGEAVADEDGRRTQSFRLHQVLRGDVAVETVVTARIDAAVRGTAVLFGRREAAAADVADGQGVRWSAVAADEPLLAHVVAAPAVGEPSARRLAWFIPRLEHPEPAIAADAFTECGLAPYAAVRSAVGAFDADKLRRCVGEPAIDQRRRGFYGLALGLVAAADPVESAAAVAALRAAIESPADDFRAGLDGLMAGVLVAEGERGLDYLDGRGFFGPRARPLDQKHLLSALRFAWESLGDSIPRVRTAAATATLLASPVVAADATIDLARYGHWDAVDEVARLWTSLGGADAAVRRAVAGYLAACPLPAARRHLDRIRAADPERLEQALQAAALPR